MMAMDWDLFFAKIFTYVFKALFRILLYIGTFLELRYGLFPPNKSIKPSRQVLVRSTGNALRTIKVNVFEPPSYDSSNGPLPVHVNFHGCGFVLPVFGADSELCTYWTSRLNCIVLDADYGKGPAYPHPTAVEDALDVLRYIASHPDIFDISKVTCGGFSSGANIAILASLRSPGNCARVKAVVAWYPPTDLTRVGDRQKSSTIRNRIHKSFRHCYLPTHINRMDAKVSPLYADPNLFPPLTLIVGENDKLLVDSRELAKRLQDNGNDCVLYTVPGAGHAWERFIKHGTPLWEERKRALSLMEGRLQLAYGSNYVGNIECTWRLN